MRKMTFAAAILGACVLVTPLVQAAGVHETFNQYSVGGSTNSWYYSINYSPISGVYIWDGDATAATNPAAGFYLAQNAYMDVGAGPGGDGVVAASTVCLETENVKPWVDGQFYSSWVAIDSMDAGVPLSTVNSIGYYILVDLDNNGSLDRWYMNTITGSAPASEDWYLLPTINATDSGWQRYDAVGANFVAVGSPGAIEAGVTDHTVSLGLQFNLNSFTPVGSNYMAVWADNIFTGAVPEPSGLLLACFGALGILARRGRRQSA